MKDLYIPSLNLNYYFICGIDPIEFYFNKNWINLQSQNFRYIRFQYNNRHYDILINTILDNSLTVFDTILVYKLK